MTPEARERRAIQLLATGLAVLLPAFVFGVFGPTRWLGVSILATWMGGAFLGIGLGMLFHPPEDRP